MKIVAFVTEPASIRRILAHQKNNALATKSSSQPDAQPPLTPYPLRTRSCFVLNFVNRLRCPRTGTASNLVSLAKRPDEFKTPSLRGNLRHTEWPSGYRRLSVLPHTEWTSGYNRLSVIDQAQFCLR